VKKQGSGIRKQGVRKQGSGIRDSPNPYSGRVKKVGGIAGRKKMKIKPKLSDFLRRYVLKS